MSGACGLVDTKNSQLRRWREVFIALNCYFMTQAQIHRTCFWAGDTFAPKLHVTSPDGKDVSIQKFLQDTFLNMWSVLAKAVGDLEGVLGFEVQILC